MLAAAARLAIRTSSEHKAGLITASYRNETLYLTLPSGRSIAYPQARLMRSKFEDAPPDIMFKDNSRGAWDRSAGMVWHPGRERGAGRRPRCPSRGHRPTRNPRHPRCSERSRRSRQSGKLAVLPVLAEVQRLIVLVDHDLNGEGQSAADQLERIWRAAGRSVRQLLPDRPGDDFNDVVLRGRL
jgi:hypothetical protein